jgi:hypothetical protein
MNTKMIYTLAFIAFAAAFVYFLSRSLKFVKDHNKSFTDFVHKHFPTTEERRKVGHNNLYKLYRNYVLGYYFCTVASFYGLVNTLIKILKSLYE